MTPNKPADESAEIRYHNCPALYNRTMCMILGDYCPHKSKEVCDAYASQVKPRESTVRALRDIKAQDQQTLDDVMQ